ncbi:MAG: SusD/RagB family nutrient-binding outer membrane lipoprotein [Bacteroidales bacterium]|nr:SusD/RagB family nutrient-binding outer membrane lipoprotein [Bacteroidales bacterium]
MKKALKYILLSVLFLTGMSSCIKEDTNMDPNNPQEVPSNILMSGAEKWIMDNVYDVWFSGRQCLLYAQYWAQRNYTEEDRYQIRESTNNGYFNYLYMGIANLLKVEYLNTDPEFAPGNSAYGLNANQIAAAKILKIWLMQIITDTWGSVPYSEVGKLESDEIYYAKYDDQKELYNTLLAELDEAIGMIDESEPAFTSGDVIYGGDASKWKKFGNSLKCRLAIHISKVDASWKTKIAEAVASGVFESNDDAAAYTYSASGSDYCKFYEGFYEDGRNDFTITKPFVQLLAGEADEMNGKSHPWAGTKDPRHALFASGSAKGMPYGAPTANSQVLRTGTPNWYSGHPAHLNQNFKVPLMTYAELLFILSEYNGFSDDEFQAGIDASLEYWADAYGSSISQEDADAYKNAVGSATEEKVAVQKYIDLWLNGTEAWTEIRRTGYPEQVLRPGEKTAELNGNAITFEPLSDVKNDIIARVKYPTNESTLNGANWKEAVAKLDDGTNNYYTKMFWDVRKSTYDHPANK